MKTSLSIITAVSALLFGVVTAHADISVYISAPGGQTAAPAFLPEEKAGVDFSVEGFEAPFAFGAVSGNGGVYEHSPFSNEVPGSEEWRWIATNLMFGGTHTGGGAPEAGAAERYLTADPQGQVITITFGTSVNYFGFFWSAGSVGNRITLYNDANVALGSFDTTDLVTLLPNTVDGRVTAINGAEYNTADFYKQPGTNSIETNQAFAFLHFINNGGLGDSIKKVVLEQVSAGGGFESDNHTVAFVAPVVSGSTSNLILVKEQIPDAVPEPSSVLLLGGAGAVAWYLRRRNRSRN